MPAFGRTISYLRIYLLLIFCQSYKIPHDAKLIKNDPVERAKKVSVKYSNLPFFRPKAKACSSSAMLHSTTMDTLSDGASFSTTMQSDKRIKCRQTVLLPLQSSSFDWLGFDMGCPDFNFSVQFLLVIRAVCPNLYTLSHIFL